MLDRSGSMYGMPMHEAKKALIIALQMLTIQVSNYAHMTVMALVVVIILYVYRIALLCAPSTIKWSGLAPVKVITSMLLSVLVLMCL